MHIALAVAIMTSWWTQDPVKNPAQEQEKPDQEKPKPGEHTYEVVGRRMTELQEEDRIGPYDQPRWTATRRFPTTRIYVVPQGKIEFEWWARTTFPKDGGPAETRFLWEIEIGMPHRLQLDLYLGMEESATDGGFEFSRQQVEVRWALAEWGVIFGNPTFYVEYVDKSGESDAAEFKLLFGGEITSGLHWGLNVVFERTLHDELNNEWQFTAGVSKTITDMELSAGVELQFIWEDTHDDRGDYEKTYFLGPSVQWRPLPQMSVNLVLLAGLGADSPRARTFVNIGWEF